MARRAIMRKVVSPPCFSGFKPYGECESEGRFIELYFEEFEALKLTDYENLKHCDACQKMGVSRATFARIYETARRKIAQAMVECLEIRTVAGNSFFDAHEISCANCKSEFRVAVDSNIEHCPKCRQKGHGCAKRCCKRIDNQNIKLWQD